MVITICGSTRFKEQILKTAHDLTLQNHIVFMPNVFVQADDENLTTEQKIMLDNLHREKIEMSDAIFVVNVDGYIGESTYGEIDWATRKKKEIYFLVDPNPKTVAKQDDEVATAPAEPAND